MGDPGLDVIAGARHAASAIECNLRAMPKYGQPWKLEPERLGPFAAVYLPWLEQWAKGNEFPTLVALDETIERERERRAPFARPLRFVSAPRPGQRRNRDWVTADVPYDARITLMGEVPCLPQSYHDLFNALTFAAFPRAKRALHERQYRALCLEKEVPGKRSRERDALTVLDEATAIVVAPEEMRRGWQDNDPQLHDVTSFGIQAVLFGHGLLERLHDGHVDVRAGALVLWSERPLLPCALLDAVDAFLWERLNNPRAFVRPESEAILEWRRGGTCTFRRADPARKKTSAC